MEYKISVIGLGYVGLVTAACFASKGFKVYGFDVDVKKLEILREGRTPIYEPGLEELVRRGIEDGTLKVETRFERAVKRSNITFITVNTPGKSDGSVNLSYIKKAAEMIGVALRNKRKWHLVVVKSTVPPGTTENIVKPIIEENTKKECGKNWGICYNPEFLKEGSAIEDMFNPDRIIIGEVDRRSGDFLERVYRSFYGENMPPLIRTNPINAELIKYANNAFIATKISFINMFANLCQKLPKSDVEVIARGIGLDRRIGPLFLKAGAGFGGSCLPKDIKALITFSKNLGYDPTLLKAVEAVNDAQPQQIIELAKKHLGNLKNKHIAILGLAFKPNTDDMREARSIPIISRLLDEGAKITAYDPVAIPKAKTIFGDKIKYASSTIQCIKDADCCILVTEWEEFKKLTQEDFIKNMKKHILIDGRRIYDPKQYRKLKFEAIGLGK